MIIPTMSIRQPWASLIIDGPKRIENRPKVWHYRGLILIHASVTLRKNEMIRAGNLVRDKVFEEGARVLAQGVLQRGFTSPCGLPVGGIIGIAQLTGCLTAEAWGDGPRDPFFMGPYGLVLDKVYPLPFHRCAGRLGLWRCDYPTDKLPADLRALAETLPQS